jgi:hypothetical protein
VTIRGEGRRGTVEAAEPIHRADPQSPGSILPDDPHGIVGQAVWVAGVVMIRGEVTRSPVEAVEPARRAKPQDVGPIFDDRVYRVVAQAAWVPGVVAVSREAFGARIPGIQARRRANPQRPGSILVQMMDGIAAQAVWAHRVIAILDDGVAVVPVEPVVRAEPDEAGAVLHERQHSLVRQPLLDGDVRECDAAERKAGHGSRWCLGGSRSLHANADDGGQEQQAAASVPTRVGANLTETSPRHELPGTSGGFSGCHVRVP